MNRWDADRANKWYSDQPWLVGCNFIPSTAINQLEMWQADTFDLPTIERELAWAAGLGMNTARVYLHDLAWLQDETGFKSRMDAFLDAASARGVRPMFVFFDDCWNDNPRIGVQPAPVPGVHNSGWLNSPGTRGVTNPSEWARLERYVKDIVDSFGHDARVLMWDLYNEPGNRKLEERSLPLLCKAFEWAREIKPEQPLSAGIWCENVIFNTFQAEASDVVTFHNYNDAAALAAHIARLRVHGRPIICTEWLRREHSEVAACLPVFRKERVGCLNWGLVSGKTQTIYPWGSPENAPEPKRWFHDLLKKDGSPHDVEEVRLFREMTG
ncbi:MAG: 1,4-beta-xylanase [Planctomycetes bacterium]|nr:1,4-beta-xylanase [Planctomycetota bacterium]